MNAVIGTAGHVDHGKSSLIKALTGIHPSHLPQELLREMTIDLGFAHFSTDEGETIGIIDAPGHERFIRNMVSAVWGLDIVLFVVAADEGWAALSSEHLRIIAAMGIKQCILVLTKSDLVDKQRLSEVENEALEHFLTEMELLPEVIAVSSHTNQGIEALKQLIIKKVATIDKREDLDHQAHLYVDRVFSVNGVGTTVTGTLRGGEIKEGDTLTLFPSKQTVKVRSLQSYHQQLDTAPPYARTAVALKQLNRKFVSRGSCLVKNPEAVTMSNDWIIQLTPHFCGALKKQSIVEVALGTAHVQAKCYLYADSTLARLQFEEAIPAFWGQPLLLIQHGGSRIIGAGRLVWSQPIQRKTRLILQEILPTLTIHSATMAQTKLTLQLALNGYAQQNTQLIPPPKTITLGDWWINELTLKKLQEQCNKHLNSAIQAISVEELARNTQMPLSLIEALCANRCTSGEWQKIDGNIILAALNKNSALPPNQQQLLEAISQTHNQGYDASKSPLVGVKRLLRALTERQLIIPTENDLFFSKTAYDEIVANIMKGRPLHEKFSVADARDSTGLSRKQLIPLLNRLEKDGWVKRIENDRIVCKAYE